MQIHSSFFSSTKEQHVKETKLEGHKEAPTNRGTTQGATRMGSFVARRKTCLEWLEMFQGEEPILHLNGKPQPHNPMSQEEADLHLALFDKEIEPTRDIQVQLAQLELLRQPDSGKHHFKLWKLMFPEFFARG